MNIMNDSAKYTAFCGLYCKDCIPTNRELFNLVERLRNLLDEANFEKYAELLAGKNTDMKEYATFRKFLESLQKLQCIHPCSEGPMAESGCSKSCAIRQCALQQELEGCWDCPGHPLCEKLAWHKTVHPGLARNLSYNFV